MAKKVGLVFDSTIPASSSPWQTLETTTPELNKQLVHYANNETNGAYYTWCAATVGCNSETYSICPRRWKLPTKVQYDTLLNSAGISDDKAGSAKIRGAPYNFPYAGGVGNDSLSNVGSGGYYWSSTAYGADYAYSLYFGSNSVNTYWKIPLWSGRYYGDSVRCIAP